LARVVRSHRVIVLLRWTLAAVIGVIAIVLVAYSRITTGPNHEVAQYLIMIAFHFGALVVPTLIAIDAVGNVIRALFVARRNNLYAVGKFVALAVIADALLLALGVIAFLLVYEYR
jgi:hypothetical protein